MTVNWQEPIEAYHTDGRVVAVDRIGGYGDHCVRPDLEGGWFAFREDGTHFHTGCKWTIRNTPQTPSQPRTEPSQENGSGEVFERMKALCEAVAKYEVGSNIVAEARAIMVLLAPVDGDLVEAKRIKQEAYDADRGSMPEDWITVAVANGIKRGRQLERGGE